MSSHHGDVYISLVIVIVTVIVNVSTTFKKYWVCKLCKTQIASAIQTLQLRWAYPGLTGRSSVYHRYIISWKPVSCWLQAGIHFAHLYKSPLCGTTSVSDQGFSRCFALFHVFHQFVCHPAAGGEAWGGEGERRRCRSRMRTRRCITLCSSWK